MDMAYDGKLLARARRLLEEQRIENEAERQRRTELVYERVPEIRRIDGELRRQMAELARLALGRAADLDERLAALREANLDGQRRRAELLVEHGWPINYLDEIVSCPVCRDVGMVDGQVCDCLKKLYNQELTRELGTLLQHGDESFERFDLSLYGETPLEGDSIAPRRAMSNILQLCRQFADEFPDVTTNLLFQGRPGLGKTYLSACIAREAAEKGCSVCYDSAAAAFEAFEQQRFARDPETAEAAALRVRRMLDCDLMILDDLGTEMITSLTLSALYTLLNSRLTRKKPIIISTNLTDEQLQQCYTPQICSRLKGEFLRLRFIGQDIRLMK